MTKKKDLLPPRSLRRNFDRAAHTLRYWRLRERKQIAHRVKVTTATGETIHETHYQEIVL